jgi:catechol 2,3-dioxygenase-like lactoylglutathione lyase family enzyme
VTVRLQSIAVDSPDPQRIGRWWADALGWEGRVDEEGDFCVAPPGGGATELLFLRVPEPKSVKNRVHLDLRPDDQAAEVARFERLGATRVDVGQAGDPDVTWVVLADPEGNEFCILRATAPDGTG